MPRRREVVPLDPFQERFRELRNEGVSISSICKRAGLVNKRGHGNTTYLQRMLGLKPFLKTRKGKSGQGYWYFCHNIGYDNAVKLAKAMDMDPHEAGI